MIKTSPDLIHAQPFSGLFDLHQHVPRLDGTLGDYINLDNAASTPPLRSVENAVSRFMRWYSSVHRGAGYKSQLSTHLYESAREITLKFVGADPRTHVCIFGKNTTEAINKLARRFPFPPGRDVVLISLMEHHSNDLPYRNVATVVRVMVGSDGELDEADFDNKLNLYGDRIALVAITGASNVTGSIPRLHRLAEKTHSIGAHFFVDAAQLAPHRKIEMGSLEDPGHFDYLALSGHKMYAPYGTGALIARRDIFESGEPDLRGGGQIELVTEESVLWSEPPEREEAGSPNVVGAVALAAAIKQLESIGMELVAEHEIALTGYALRRLSEIEGIELYGNTDPGMSQDRVGVIPFNLQGIPHFLVAAILGYEFGIGVRNGCFCAHPYILHLLNIPAAGRKLIEQQMRAGDRRQNPGLVRASFGLYNTFEDINRLSEALEKILLGEYSGRYVQNRVSGDFYPQGWQARFEDFFMLHPEPVFKTSS